MNRPPRRVRSPGLFGFDQRAPMGGPRDVGCIEQRPIRPGDYDDPYPPGTPFDQQPGLAASANNNFAEPPPGSNQQYPSPINYRDHQRLPSTYRATLSREPQQLAPSATYKILCITNINHKVGDGPVKDALTNDFSRFGDISVSICHDSGERLAYIYFRTYEEAREARHAKTRTLLFDRPIEIEPIYEPARTSPIESSPPPPAQVSGYPPPPSRRRSITPPDYYGPRRHPLPGSHHHRGISPPNYSHSQRYPTGPSPPMASAPMPYGRYYMAPAPPLPPPSPYSSPPHDQYRSYHPHHYAPPGPAYHHYGGPMSMGRERGDRGPVSEGHLSARSPRHEAYYPPIDHRSAYPQPPPPMAGSQHSPRVPASSMQHSSSSHQHPNLSPSLHHHHSSSRGRSPPPYPDHHHGPRYMSREYRLDFKREKFSSDGYGIEPEEGRPSRVLFITNIDSTKSHEEVRTAFEPFGVIEDFEVKKVSSNISSALIKFTSMDCAYKAKTAINGKPIGATRCRITYGKVSASRRLWIGGLGPTTTLACLDDEFGKFGEIINLDYVSGRPYAYIEFENANQAQFANHHLKGTLAAGAERRIRIEYVDPVDRTDKVAKQDTGLQGSNLRSRTTKEPWSANEPDTSPQSNNRKRSITPPDITAKRVAGQRINSGTNKNSNMSSSNSYQADENSSNDKNELNNNQETEGNDNNNGIDTNNRVTNDTSTDDTQPSLATRLVLSKSIRHIIDCCSISWFGQLVLRNFNFSSKMFLCSGRKATIEKYITKLDGAENGDSRCPVLRITQRWRLHPQPKLEEVKRRMQSGNLGMLIITSRRDQSPSSISSPTCKTPQSSNCQVTLATNGTEEGTEDKNDDYVGTKDGTKAAIEDNAGSGNELNTQSRPLKNLISYLEQKDAAGVISLNALDIDHHHSQNDQAPNSNNQVAAESGSSKLLYAFPPGEFALNLLRRIAPNLEQDSIKEEFLLGVIVGGGLEAKI